MILDTVNRSLEVLLGAAVASSELTFFASYADHTAAAFTPAANAGQTNGVTAVTLVAAPLAAAQRQLKSVSIHNLDAAPAVVTVRLNDGGAYRIVEKAILAVGETLTYEAGAGWNLTGPAWASSDVVGSHAGGSGLECWYAPGLVSATAVTTGAPSANVLRAIPFQAPRRRATLDRIGVNVTTLLAGLARLGLYRASSESNLYPGALVVDAGEVDTTTTGVKTRTISVQLEPGAIYWVAYVSNAAATLRCLALASISAQLLGFSNAFGTAPNLGLSVAHVYAALPSTFTAGGAVITAVPVPAIGIRYSA